MTALSKAYSVGCAKQLRLLTRPMRADENIFTEKTTQRLIKQQAEALRSPNRRHKVAG